MNVRYIHKVILSICLIFVLALNGCSKERIVDTTNMRLIVSGTNEGIKWEVYNDNLNNKTIILKDGKFNEEMELEYNPELPLITLPSVETSKNLERGVEITHNTYKSGIVQSLEYLNYLKNDGYTINSEVLTSSYYEVVLSSAKMEKQKRLIITKSYIVEYNSNDITFDIKNYIN